MAGHLHSTTLPEGDGEMITSHHISRRKKQSLCKKEEKERGLATSIPTILPSGDCGGGGRKREMDLRAGLMRWADVLG